MPRCTARAGASVTKDTTYAIANLFCAVPRAAVTRACNPHVMRVTSPRSRPKSDRCRAQSQTNQSHQQWVWRDAYQGVKCPEFSRLGLTLRTGMLNENEGEISLLGPMFLEVSSLINQDYNTQNSFNTSSAVSHRITSLPVRFQPFNT